MYTVRSAKLGGATDVGAWGVGALPSTFTSTGLAAEGSALGSVLTRPQQHYTSTALNILEEACNR
jgi:hypothetical protein